MTRMSSRAWAESPRSRYGVGEAREGDETAGATSTSGGTSGMRRIAYLFPLFPVINQTFTLAEVVGMKARGFDVPLFSLLSRVDPKLQQAEARGLIEQTH